jgi:hypothetical protein
MPGLYLEEVSQLVSHKIALANMIPVVTSTLTNILPMPGLTLLIEGGSVNRKKKYIQLYGNPLEESTMKDKGRVHPKIFHIPSCCGIDGGG